MPLAKNAVTLSFCHTANPSSRMTAILVSRRLISPCAARRGHRHARRVASTEALRDFVLDSLTKRREVAGVRTDVVFDHGRNFVVAPAPQRD